jgi:chemotaxis signal transduction protein
MKGQAVKRIRCPEEISMLTFTVMGVRMGVDADQIAEVMEVDRAEGYGLAVYRFHEMISFCETTIQYHAPKAIMIKDKKEPYIVLIDNPEDIASVKVRSIQPMPPLIAMNSGMRMFWGAIPGNHGIILLVDFLRLRERQGGRLQQMLKPINIREVRE